MLLSMSNHYQTCAARRQNGAGWTLTFENALDTIAIEVRERSLVEQAGVHNSFCRQMLDHEAEECWFAVRGWLAMNSPNAA